MERNTTLIIAVVIGLVIGIGAGYFIGQGDGDGEQIEELQMRVDELEAQVQSLQSNNTDLQNQIDSLQTQIDSLESENDQLEQENQELMDEVDMLETAESAVVTVEQEAGNTVYWVLPGQRRISKAVFGTPDNPLLGQDTLEIRMQQARMLPSPLNDTVVQLLQDLPIMVSLPEQLRQTNAEGTEYTKTTIPVPFGNQSSMVTSGALSCTYYDNQPIDIPGLPTNTTDDFEMQAWITDPAGNNYTWVIKSVLMPPIPEWETGGGVITNAWHHGTTGTGPPLMPSVYSYGATWTVADLYINGELAEANTVVHVMTTQIIRDKDYRLALDEELPLSRSNTIAGIGHHTHIMDLPVVLTPEGPVNQPINTSFMLPTGQNQPFIHAMYEQETIVLGPRGYDEPEYIDSISEMDEAPDGDGEPSEVTININGTEFEYNPSTFTVKQGQTVEVVFRNVGSIAHNIRFGEWDVQTATISSGETATITFTPEETGTFDYWCTIPGHRAQGMEGQITVEAN